MAKDTLTSRLVTTRSFAPGEPRAEAEARTEAAPAAPRVEAVPRVEAAPAAPRVEAAPVEPPAPSAGLDDLVRREEHELKRQSIAQSWSEVRQRRREVLVDLDRAVQVLEKRQREVEELRRTLRQRREAVAGIDAERADVPTLETLRRMKQDLHDAHVELAVYQRLEARDADGRRVALSDLGFSDLTRIGLGLFWPLMAAIVAGAVVLALGFRLALAL